LLQDPSKISGDKLNNVRHENIGISGIKRGNIRKIKLMGLQQKIRTRTLETFIWEETNLREATNLEVIW
jgi:hypothetical protein